MVVTCNAGSFLWPSVDEVGSILLGLTEELEGRQLVLDFGDVDYLSGAALEKLVVLQRKAAAEGSTLIIDNVSSYLLEIFSVTGLTGIIDVNPSSFAGAGV
jgi:anti-sigma B factor antagonist